MGMFDTVWTECPSCGRQIDWQSKAGECTLTEYTLKDIPAEIALDLNNDTRNCKCGAVVVFRTASWVYSEVEIL